MKPISTTAHRILRPLPAATVALLMAHPAHASRPDYYGGPHGDPHYAHDGGLRWAIGVQNVQVARSAPENPSQTDGSTTIYRHHPMMAYWGGLYWVMYEGGGTRLAWSADGLTWSAGDTSPIFGCCSHHRMGFYVASNGVLLASHWSGPEKGGPGSRLVREIFGPHAYGPIFEIKANHQGPDPNNSWPHYTTSPSPSFVSACDELLGNGLFAQQWQEEDQDPSFYATSTGDGDDEWKAFSWWQLPDGRIAGAWKGLYTSVSTNSTWQTTTVPNPVPTPSFRVHGGAKTWGQRTEDGRYAFVGCANDGDDRRRWPLAVTTATDGLTFDTPYLAIAGDIPPARYENEPGDNKNAGPQYVRGISPGNGDPPGGDMWLTYSMNKEDIWVAAVPMPVLERMVGDVYDDFQVYPVGPRVRGWNTYSPQWAPVGIADSGTNRVLRLEDRDPVDYASATRVFEQTSRARLAFRVMAHQTGSSTERLEIDVLGNDGDRAVAIAFDSAVGQITAEDGSGADHVADYSPSTWVNVEIQVAGDDQRYSLSVDGVEVLSSAACLEDCTTVERITFRTGRFRLRDFNRRPTDDPWLSTRLAGADAMQPRSLFDIDDVALEHDASLNASIGAPTDDDSGARQASDSGGACAVTGSRSQAPWLPLVALVGLATRLRRRRRRRR
ncbi:MAG: hypothetical protein JRI23_25575 [Deltaproteobacteria bacterium]|jgi:hypothetical protein|nr:hypothetical protein [Deltaproteobacteria bacterium]MBW2535393.1 hypothetical protein [Deltaproteobacteria bacterium]